MTLNYEKISKRLHQIRNQAGASQAEMGKILGIGQYYGNVERGAERPSEQALLNIAERLGISYDWLLDGSGEPPSGEAIGRITLAKQRPDMTPVLPKMPASVEKAETVKTMAESARADKKSLSPMILIECRYAPDSILKVMIPKDGEEPTIELPPNLTIKLHHISALDRLIQKVRDEVAVVLS